MRRRIRVKWPEAGPPPLEKLSFTPERLVLALSPKYGEVHSPLVSPGQAVQQADPVAASEHVVTHAPLSGIVSEVSSTAVVIRPGEAPAEAQCSSLAPAAEGGPADADMVRRFGLVGMGGGAFPTARKLAASRNCHTLVINGVECEPGVTIDRAILSEQPDVVTSGATALAEAIGATEILLAVRSDRAFLATLQDLYPFRLVVLPPTYPAGAEKLIVAKLEGRLPAPGELPFHAGYLVHNVATVRAVGIAVRERMPVIERPLSVARPDASIYRNVLVPVGIEIGALLGHLGVPVSASEDVVISGGLMMGSAVLPDAAVSKATTSLIVLKRASLGKPASSCIRCGACNEACPLGLHPIAIVRRFQAGTTAGQAYRTQLETCFLCGACAAVCPVCIRLTKHLRDGKECLIHSKT